jgi:hypothetical protein
MKDIFNKIPAPIAAAVKEALRLGLIAAISFLISFGLKYVGGLPQDQTTIILTFVLKGLDKWMHEHGKATDNTQLAGGITRF